MILLDRTKNLEKPSNVVIAHICAWGNGLIVGSSLAITFWTKSHTLCLDIQNAVDILLQKKQGAYYVLMIPSCFHLILILIIYSDLRWRYVRSLHAALPNTNNSLGWRLIIIPIVFFMLYLPHAVVSWIVSSNASSVVKFVSLVVWLSTAAIQGLCNFILFVALNPKARTELKSELLYRTDSKNSSEFIRLRESTSTAISTTPPRAIP
eukprot:NODE_7235_length_798_cov_27.220741_g6627_i0.p1 GENE.NODE_7235_length_798_cov_27.220741_g6627_i0~~NODE_7235_length_798_cov_27.220741_g6627_i0.p1  ORF type:complete len:241 (+),score=43.36 NODE_7235_length_798_cov_27.220741_g6627_i0:100-723(+)